VEFNAHRIFAYATILREFSSLSLISLSLIDDSGDFHEHADPAQVSKLEFGCGLYEFEKPLPLSQG